MNEEIEVIYPSDAEISEQVSFIVENSSPKINHVYEYDRSLPIVVQAYFMMKNYYKFSLQSFDIRYIFQHYLEVIVVGIMLISGLLIPSTS